MIMIEWRIRRFIEDWRELGREIGDLIEQCEMYVRLVIAIKRGQRKIEALEKEIAKGGK